jgi:hypothetical protein
VTTKERRDAFARSKGYTSYYAYRNAQAKSLGYKSYTEMRRARSTGEGLTPRDPKFREDPERTSLLLSYPRRREAAERAEAAARRLRNDYRKATRNFDESALALAGADPRRLSTDRIKTAALSVKDSLEELTRETQSFLDKDFPDMYLAGARSIDPKYKLNASDRPYISQRQTSTFNKLRGANTGALRYAAPKLGQLAQMHEVDALRTFYNRRGISAVTYDFPGGENKGHAAANRQLDDYADMLIRTEGSRAYNVAALKVGGDKGINHWEVIDGPDCGWTEHNDSDKANGKIVTLEQAQSRPLAHPNCQRYFVPRPDLDKVPKGLGVRVLSAAGRRIKESAVDTLRESATNLAAHVIADQAVRQAAADVIKSSSARFIEYGIRINQLARLYNHAIDVRKTALGNVADINRRTPPKVKPSQVMADVSSWADDFMDGRELPDHVSEILGVRKRAPRKVVGEAFGRFSRFQTATQNSLDIDTGAVKQAILEEAASRFYGWLGPITSQSKFVRYTFPNIGGGSGGPPFYRPRRVIYDLGKLGRVTRTSIKDRGIINHVSVNPNGLLRAGFSKDPETGFVTPTFRFIPPGPIHIFTRVNRGLRGDITSLSTEVRAVTKAPIVEALSSHFNLNLRRLGISTVDDIRKLTLDDLKKFERADLKGVSIAAHARLTGFNIFEIQHAFRLPWEDVEKLWHISNLGIAGVRQEVESRIRNHRYFHPVDEDKLPDQNFFIQHATRGSLTHLDSGLTEDGKTKWTPRWTRKMVESEARPFSSIEAAEEVLARIPLQQRQGARIVGDISGKITAVGHRPRQGFTLQQLQKIQKFLEDNVDIYNPFPFNWVPELGTIGRSGANAALRYAQARRIGKRRRPDLTRVT